jgi:hypothetical protein
VAENIAEHRLAHRIVRRVIASGVPERDRVSIEPTHFLIQPVPPLCPEFDRIGSHDRIDSGKDRSCGAPGMPEQESPYTTYW